MKQNMRGRLMKEHGHSVSKLAATWICFEGREYKICWQIRCGVWSTEMSWSILHGWHYWPFPGPETRIELEKFEVTEKHDTHRSTGFRAGSYLSMYEYYLTKYKKSINQIFLQWKSWRATDINMQYSLAHICGKYFDSIPSLGDKEMWVWSLDQEVSLGEGNDDLLQYSFLENPWTEESGGLQSVGLQRVCHNWTPHQKYVYHMLYTILRI